MSNTLNTPIEALELEFPLRVREYSLRRGSGGRGRFNGGDGIVRAIEALEPMQYSLIAERRRFRPRGVNGGEDGQSGSDSINGVPIAGKSVGRLEAGDLLRTQTPGGGAEGTAE
jgi:N-methylhydantoinase B